MDNATVWITVFLLWAGWNLWTIWHDLTSANGSARCMLRRGSDKGSDFDDADDGSDNKENVY